MGEMDPVKVSPGNYKILLENDRVRVLDMLLRPGETDDLHSHPSETVFFLQGGTLRIHLPTGEAQEANIPDHHVMWNDAWTHRVENIGQGDVHAIIVEGKK
ncbi:MAG: hypothetical protein V3W28_09300 [Thermoplasmata archaeon]